MARLNDDRWWSCQRKRRFKYKRVAKATAERLHRTDGDRMEIYKCVYCGGWHVAHVDPREGEARRLAKLEKEAIEGHD